jgi:3-carboxy-cis,cis-muconate cycloisomerase
LTSAGNALSVQLGGAVGTLVQMKGRGQQVIELMAIELKLKAPSACWHTQRDEWVALGCELGLLVGSLGKIAKDIALMGQHEVGELIEPLEPGGRAESNDSAHKLNSVAYMLALAAAQRAPQRVAAILATMQQEHEQALGNWQSELAEWPGLVMSAHGAARAMAQALPTLQVDTQRMRANLESVRLALPPEAAEEWFNPALAQHAAELTRLQVNTLSALQKSVAPE